MFWLRWLPSLSVIQTAPDSGADVAAWAAPAMLPEAISATSAAALSLRAVVRAGRLRGSAFIGLSSWGNQFGSHSRAPLGPLGWQHADRPSWRIANNS